MNSIPLLSGRKHSIAVRYLLAGAILGLVFPIAATLIECRMQDLAISVASLIRVQLNSPLLWIIDSAPVWLGLIAFLAGIKQQRIDAYLRSLKQVVKTRTNDLEQANGRLSDIIDSLGESLIIMDNDGVITDVNITTVQTLEYEKAELIGQPGSLILGQLGLEAVIMKGDQDIFASGFLRTLDQTYQTRSGRTIHLSISTSYLWDAGRRPSGIICVAKDMTRIRQMERQLLKAKADYENLFNSAPIPIIVAQDDRIVFFNAELEKYLGYTPEEIQGRKLIDFVPDEDRADIMRAHYRLVSGKRIEGTHSIRYVTRSGSVRWADISTTPFIWDDKPSALSFLIDITEQREFERALSESEEQYRSLVQTLNVVIMRADKQFKITFLNQFGQDFFGYSEAEVRGKSIIGTLTPKSDSAGRDLENLIKDIVENPARFANSENENICKNGERRWLVWRNMPIFNADGTVDEILSSGYDVTERRRAEEQIRLQQQKLEEASRQMNLELDQARLAQLSLLPTQLPEIPGLRLAIKYSPMAQIGGDFYDLVVNPDGSLGLLVGDVTGHGIPAALLSFMFLTTFKNRRIPGASPDQNIHNANRFLADKLPQGKYATVCCCTLDPENLILSYSSAGHPPAYLVRPGLDKPMLLQTPGMVVGMFREPLLPFQSQQVQLQRGDKVVVYTDGMMEITDGEGRMLDTEELERFIAAQGSRPVGDLLESVYAYCDQYSGEAGFNDDVTMIGIEVV